VTGDPDKVMAKIDVALMTIIANKEDANVAIIAIQKYTYHKVIR